MVAEPKSGHQTNHCTTRCPISTAANSAHLAPCEVCDAGSISNPPEKLRKRLASRFTSPALGTRHSHPRLTANCSPRTMPGAKWSDQTGASCGRVPRRRHGRWPIFTSCRRCLSARTARSPSLRQSSAWDEPCRPNANLPDNSTSAGPPCAKDSPSSGRSSTPSAAAMHSTLVQRCWRISPNSSRFCASLGLGDRNRGQLRCGRSCSAGGVGWVGDCAQIECTRRGKGVKSGGTSFAHAPAPVVIAGTWRTP